MHLKVLMTFLLSFISTQVWADYRCNIEVEESILFGGVEYSIPEELDHPSMDKIVKHAIEKNVYNTHLIDFDFDLSSLDKDDEVFWNDFWSDGFWKSDDVFKISEFDVENGRTSGYFNYGVNLKTNLLVTIHQTCNTDIKTMHGVCLYDIVHNGNTSAFSFLDINPQDTIGHAPNINASLRVLETDDDQMSFDVMIQKFRLTESFNAFDRSTQSTASIKVNRNIDQFSLDVSGTDDITGEDFFSVAMTLNCQRQ